MNKIKNIYSRVLYILFFVIISNFLINLIFDKRLKDFVSFNFYDIFSGFFLFIFLFIVGKSIQSRFQLENVSISIVIYLFSFFVLDIVILFVYKQLLFKEIFIITNVLWFLVLALNKSSRTYLPISIVGYLSLNFFVKFSNSFLTKNFNILGDVEAVFFNQAKNIYENSYYFSINNFVMEGYPQFISYFHSLFLKISSTQTNYDFYSFTSHIVFYLSILFFLELDISKKNKVLLCSIFTVFIFNSTWFQFLFTTSLMSEGLVSLFTAITLSYSLTNLKKDTPELFFGLATYGLIYFSKQFNSFITIVSVLIFYLLFKNRKILIYGLSGLIMKEFLFIFAFPNIEKDHHIRQIDLIDTIFDLLLLRELQFENVFIILKNLWIDKPFSLILLIFYFVFLYQLLFFKDFKFFETSTFFIINLNILMVFALYISVWKNMELESPIRYFLNYFHLILVYIFLNLDKQK